MAARFSWRIPQSVRVTLGSLALFSAQSPAADAQYHQQYCPHPVQVIPSAPPGMYPSPYQPLPATPSRPLPVAPGTTPTTTTQPNQATQPTQPSAQSPAAQAPTALNDQDLSGERSGAGAGESVALGSPQMMGDFLSNFAFATRQQNAVIAISDPRLSLLGINGSAATFNASVQGRFRVPLAASAGIKIAENESPRPTDRLFINFNYFDNINTFTRTIGSPTLIAGSATAGQVNALGGFGPIQINPALQQLAANSPQGQQAIVGIQFAQQVQQIAATTGQQALYEEYLRAIIRERNAIPQNVSPALKAAINQVTATLNTRGQPVPPGGFDLGPTSFIVQSAGGGFVGDGFVVPTNRLNQSREIFGFEKTFFDGRASFGVRAPLFQLQGDGSARLEDFGDLSLIGKYALINDRETGNVLSTGLMVTVPTGPSLTFAGDKSYHSTLLQPYLGGIYVMENLYVQGFSSIVVPTDGVSTVIWFNSIGGGYRINRGTESFVTSITPVIEAHVNTAMNNNDPAGNIYMPNSLDLTGGVHLGLGRRALLTLGGSVPVTGPRPFGVEGLAQFNFRF